MHMKGAWRKLLTASFLGSVLAASASAGPINLVGGTAGTIPGGATNEFISMGLFPGPQIGGFYGSQVSVENSGSSLLTIDFFGAEAGFVNKFLLALSVIFTHPGGTIIAPSLASPLGTFATTSFATGLLPFSFSTNSDSGGVANGANPDDSGGLAIGPNFFASCDPFGASNGSFAETCSSLYVFLDDGGAGPDDNHDDFLVRMTISEVPEPGTWILLGCGLIGLGALKRRQRS
jgi:hypothetical protein